MSYNESKPVDGEENNADYKHLYLSLVNELTAGIEEVEKLKQDLLQKHAEIDLIKADLTNTHNKLVQRMAELEETKKAVQDTMTVVESLLGQKIINGGISIENV